MQGPVDAALLLRLQRSAGNAAAARLVQRQAVVDVPPPPTAPRGLTPDSDPKFGAVQNRIHGKAKQLRQHPKASGEAQKARDAAVPPANDKEAQAKTAQAGKMNAAKPGDFDKKAFIASVKKAIDAAAPKTTKEAADFAESGKAEAVRDQVAGQVTAGKTAATGDVKKTTTQPPDQSKAVAKPVTPLAPEQSPPPPGDPGGQKAMPDPATPDQTNLGNGPAETSNKMAEANVTEEQLQQSNEPEFQSALDAKKAGEEHSAKAPEQFRTEERAVISGAEGAAAASGKASVAAMLGAKVKSQTQASAGKTDAKSKEEEERKKVSAKIESVFEATKKDTEEILNGLDDKVSKAFSAGEADARAAFESQQKREMDAFKDDRYSGIRGKVRWLHDKLISPPAEVNAIFDRAKKLYLDKMETVIGSVADLVGAELAKARDRIAQGRKEIDTIVAEQPASLKKFAAETAQSIGDKFDQLEQDVDAKQDSVVQDLAQKYTEARNGIDERVKALQDENKGLWDRAKDAIGGVIETIMKLKDMLLNVLSKAAGAIGKIIAHPIDFLGNLVNAVKTGLANFVGNIAEHLKNALADWLFGALAGAGIELPKTLDLQGILQLVLSIMGLTWTSIRARIVKGLGAAGEAIMGKIEQGVEVIQIIVKEGLPGLWKFVVEKMGDLEDQVIGKIKDFVITKIVVAGITWLVSLLNPASAFIKACKAIYDIVMFFVDRGSEIMEFVNSVLDSITAIASGAISGAASAIEGALKRILPLAISFLASLLGLGGISDKIKSIIEAVQKPVARVLDTIIGGAVKYGKKLFGRGVGFVKAKAKQVKAWGKAKLEQGKAWATKRVGKVKAVLSGAKAAFAMKGAGHVLTLRPGMPRVIEMASASAGPLSGTISRVLGDVERRKASVIESRAKMSEILSKGKKAGKQDRTLLEELDRYLENSEGLTNDVRQIDSLRAQIEGLGPDAPETEVSRLVTRLAKRLEIFGMRYNLQDLGPLAPPREKSLGAIGSYKEFSWGRKKDFGTLEAEHITPGSILQLLVGGWDPAVPVYTRAGPGSTYEQDTTLLITKRIADIKTDIGSLQSPSDQAEIRTVKATLNRAIEIWKKVDSGQTLTKQESDTLAGLGELFNRVLIRRVDVTIAARDQYIQELRRGQRGGMPDAQSLAAAIREIQARCSDGKIHQAALEQIGRAWPLAQDTTVRVPVQSP